MIIKFELPVYSCETTYLKIAYINMVSLSYGLFFLIYSTLPKYGSSNNCPVHCSCGVHATEYIVDCSSSNLHHFPDLSNITAKIRRLVLNDNNIKDIQIRRQKKRQYMWALWLDGNLIESLPGQLLGVMFPSLTTLSAKRNKFVHIGRYFFSDLLNLKILDLKENQITSIDKFAFRNLFKLNHLYLSYNKLGVVLPEWFVDLSSLNNIDLSHNNIKWIPSDLVWPLTLHTIRLSHNKLSLFPPLPNDVRRNEGWIYDVRYNPLFCGCKHPAFDTIPHFPNTCNMQFQCWNGFNSFDPVLCLRNKTLSTKQHSLLASLQTKQLCEPPNNVSVTVEYLRDGNLMIARCAANGFPSPKIQMNSSSGKIFEFLETHKNGGKIVLAKMSITVFSCEAVNYFGRSIKKFDPESTTSTSFVSYQMSNEVSHKTAEIEPKGKLIYLI